MAQAPTIIKYADIRSGDTIRAAMYEFGAKVERTGKVAYKADGLRTNDHGNIYRNEWHGDWEFELLDRPVPHLPQFDGALIIATKVRGQGGSWVASRVDGRWWTLGYAGGFGVHEDSVITEWTLAKVEEDK